MRFLLGLLVVFTFGALAIASDQNAPASPPPVDVLRASMKDIKTALEEKRITSLQLVDTYLARIEANNTQGLKLRAVIETAPYENLRELAKKLDAERAQGKTRGILHGIPILIKDNIATGPELKMNTTAGSYALLSAKPKADADVVTRLRKAGAIILGKTNMSEFAGIKAALSSGWSARGGYTKSAFRDDLDVCGSSSGSAVAVSAGWAAASIGTETDGSITCPASRAGLYAIKPTINLTSTAGTVPISSFQDVVGPLAKSAWDVAVLLDVMSNLPANHIDPENKGITHEQHIEDGLKAADSFKGLRIGVPNAFYSPKLNYIETEDALMKLLEINSAIDNLAKLGADIVRDVKFVTADLLDSKSLLDPQETLLYYDFKKELNKYLEGTEGGAQSYDEIIKFMLENIEQELPQDECCMGGLLKGWHSDHYDEVAAGAENKRLKQHQHDIIGMGMETMFRAWKLDAVIVPADTWGGKAAAFDGYPYATVPFGLTKSGQPYGVQFIAPKWSDNTLLRIMYAWEMNFPPRPVPERLYKDVPAPPPSSASQADAAQESASESTSIPSSGEGQVPPADEQTPLKTQRNGDL